MQSLVAMSSAEAQLYSLVKVASEAMGIQALMADMGWTVRVRVWLDSSAAKSIASRSGLGRVRHVEVKYLWIQEAVRAGRPVVEKIPGKENPPDMLTKPISSREVKERRLLASIGGEVRRRSWADIVDPEEF